MKRTNTWVAVGTLTTRIAARLTARREAEIQEGSAAEDRREPRMESAGSISAIGASNDALEPIPVGRGDEGARLAGGRSDQTRGAADVWEGAPGSSANDNIQDSAVGSREGEPASFCAPRHAGSPFFTSAKAAAYLAAKSGSVSKSTPARLMPLRQVV